MYPKQDRQKVGKLMVMVKEIIGNFYLNNADRWREKRLKKAIDENKILIFL